MDFRRQMQKCLFIFFTACLFGEGGKSVSLEDSTISVLDMREYYKEETRQEFVKKLSSAMHELGFVAITNTGVSSLVLDRAYDAAKEFFSMPLETKLKYDSAAKNYQRGYQPFYKECAKGNNVADFKEFLHIGRHLTKEQQDRLGYHENMWPDEFDLESPVMELYYDLEQYMIPIQKALADAVNIKTDIFHNMTKEGDCMLRVSHYPVPKEGIAPGSIWAAAHTDIDLFTILPRATTDGLEVKDKEGNWIRVIVPEGAFIINVGDMLENMTNGFFRSATHRVIATENNKEDRYSMVLFVHPCYNDKVDPLPSCIKLTGGVQKYACGTRQEFLMERLADLGYASKEMLIELAESKFMERLIDFGRASPDAMKRLRQHGLASDKVLSKLSELGS